MTSALRKPFFTLLLALTTACCGAALPAQDRGTLRIGTWNLEHFGQRHSPPRSAADIVRLAAAIRGLGVSVLAVQEIAGPDALRQLAAKIGPGWRLVLGTTGGWSDGKSRQSIGFLYDGSRVELLHAEELLQFPRRLEDVPIFHRIPVTACFRDQRTGFDFRCVTVHFKASTGPVNEQKRRLEATTLHGWLEGLQARNGEDQDVVVLGDFNSTYGTAVQRALERGAVVRYLEQLRAEPTIMHFDDPIDQIAVGPGLTEIVADSFDSHSEDMSRDEPERTRWRHSYSDHFAVTADLRIRRDEDPAASFDKGPQRQWLPPTLRKTPGLAAAAPATVRAGASFRAGSSVTVYLSGPGNAIKGELLEPLGEHWLYLRDSKGVVQAIPTASVRRIVLH